MNNLWALVILHVAWQLVLVLGAVSARTGGVYEVTVEALASGGRSTSSSYALDGTTGDHGGVSQDFSETKTGFIGVLQDVEELRLESDQEIVVEQLPVRLTAMAVLDDGSVTLLRAGEVDWSVLSGSAIIDGASGVLLSGPVYRTEVVSYQAGYEEKVDTGQLTVLNADADDFGSYAGDGIDDFWQVHYFGEPPNALAAPDRNPDGDPYDNLFEYLSGHAPDDASSHLRFEVEGVSGGMVFLRLSRAIPGRQYRILGGGGLDGIDEIVTTYQSNSFIEDLTFEHGNGLDAAFYKLEISLP